MTRAARRRNECVAGCRVNSMRRRTSILRRSPFSSSLSISPLDMTSDKAKMRLTPLEYLVDQSAFGHIAVSVSLSRCVNRSPPYGPPAPKITAISCDVGHFLIVPYI